MQIAIYSRKSKLAEKGESIQNQIEMCKTYAYAHFSITDANIHIYIDEGYSGGNTERPEFKKLLYEVAKKNIDTIICYRLDRISRNVLDFSNFLDMLSKHKAAFVSITEHFDTTTPMGRAMVNIAAVFAQLERETIAERIRDNMHRLARTGRYIGSTPAYGFISKKIEYLDDHGNKKKMHELSPVPDDIKFVKIVFEKYLEHESLSQVETWLMKNKYPNKNGNYIGVSELRRMLSNPVYVKADEKVFDYYLKIGSEVINNKDEFNGEHGMLIYGRHDRINGGFDPKKWMVVLAKHNGIIDSDRWLYIQNILDANKIKAPRAGTSKHGLLTSKIKCAKCGGTMVVIYGKTRDKHYYKCRNKIKSRKALCDIKNIIGRDADIEIYDYLIGLSNNQNSIVSVLHKQRPDIKQNTEFTQFEKLRLIKLIKEKETEIRNLTVQFRENKSSAAAKYIISDIETLDMDITELNQQISLLTEEQNSVDDYETETKKTVENITNFGKNAEDMSFEEKRKVIDKIIDKVIWNGSEFTIVFR